jgi:hypothetical protein
MKNTILIIALTITVLSNAQSNQISYPQRELGLDLSFGKSVFNQQYITKLGYSGSLLFAHLTNSKKWKQEIGIRFTNLRNETEKEFFPYKQPSDTFRIRNIGIRLLDFPVNFKRIFSLNEKLQLFINVGFFYTYYISRHTTSNIYLNNGEMLLKKEIYNYKKSYAKQIWGLDFGLGLHCYTYRKSSICISGHLNVRTELDILGDGYFYPNITIGYRYKI